MLTGKDKIIWTKMSGAENSFWIAYFPHISCHLEQEGSKLAQTFCRREKADGLVILQPSSTCDFKWLFYNADGSVAEMCGNAACCVTDYIFKKKLISPKTSFFLLETKAGKIRGDLFKGSARIFLKRKPNIQGPFEICFQNQKIQYQFIQSLVPHAVIKVQNALNDKEKNWEHKKSLAKFLRKQTTHHKKGMNVSFYWLKKESAGEDFSDLSEQVFALSFERGVEDFTPACGTGALAVAEVYRQQNTDLQSIFVEMPGGRLKISFHSDNKISLMSPVKWIEEKVL